MANIDKVGYDIDGGEFKLTITPKSGLNSPEKDQIVFDYSGTAADLVILVGGANETHFPILNILIKWLPLLLFIFRFTRKKTYRFFVRRR